VCVQQLPHLIGHQEIVSTSKSGKQNRKAMRSHLNVSKRSTSKLKQVRDTQKQVRQHRKKKKEKNK
jgi:hypothetical protein